MPASSANDLRGTWKPTTGPGVVDGNVGRIVLNTPDLSAVLTEQGWFRLGVPDDVRAKVPGTVQ